MSSFVNINIIYIYKMLHSRVLGLRPPSPLKGSFRAIPVNERARRILHKHPDKTDQFPNPSTLVFRLVLRLKEMTGN